MSILKRSFRSTKQKAPASQFVVDQGPKECTKKRFVDNRTDAGRILRRQVKQVAGGEGEKRNKWKSVSSAKRKKSALINENMFTRILNRLMNIFQ